MNLYIENKSAYFVLRAYDRILKNTGKDVHRAILICRRGLHISTVKHLRRKKRIGDIECVIFKPSHLKAAMKLANRTRRFILLTYVVDHKLSARERDILSSAKRLLKIHDYTGDADNIEFYRSESHILYRTENEDTVLDVDLMHLYKFYETQYQCRFSSCMGGKLYVDANKRVDFCPYHKDESFVGTLDDDINYFDTENMLGTLRKTIEKRDVCKSNCPHFELCGGGCPLEEGCLGFPERMAAASEAIDKVIDSRADVSTLGYAVGKIVIKDALYEE